METNHLDCIVSLTSWKGRINSDIVPFNIFLLLHQKTEYRYKVVLVLAEEEFPNKWAELPTALLIIARACPDFDIVWCKKNTKALKKLTGSQALYPDLPIITTDDDIAVKDNFVQTFMDAHLEHPDDIISPTVWKYRVDFDVTGMARLYPPNSLADLPDDLFMKYFQGLEDDVWNGLRASMKGTRHWKLGAWPFYKQVRIGNTALSNTYGYTNVRRMVRTFREEYGK
jgi:hypothetical protein